MCPNDGFPMGWSNDFNKMIIRIGNGEFILKGENNIVIHMHFIVHTQQKAKQKMSHVQT